MELVLILFQLNETCEITERGAVKKVVHCAGGWERREEMECVMEGTTGWV